MAITTQQRLDSYLSAEARILAGQSVSMGDRRLQLADLAEVRAEIKNLQAQVSAEKSASKGQFGPKVMLADFSGCR